MSTAKVTVYLGLKGTKSRYSNRYEVTVAKTWKNKPAKSSVPANTVVVKTEIEVDTILFEPIAPVAGLKVEAPPGYDPHGGVAITSEPIHAIDVPALERPVRKRNTPVVIK